MTKKRSDRMRKQAAKVTKVAAEVQQGSVAAEDLLTKLEDRDRRRELRQPRRTEGK
jgi:hypothetical protein